MSREACHVHFVDRGAGIGVPQRAIPLPVVTARIRDHALHRLRRVVARLGRRRAIVGVGHGDRPAVRVKQHFLRIESESPRRLERPMRPVSVDLAGSHLRNGHMPVMVSAVPVRVEGNYPRGPGGIDRVEEEQVDFRGVLRVDGEVDALASQCGAERKGAPGCNCILHDSLLSLCRIPSRALHRGDYTKLHPGARIPEPEPPRHKTRCRSMIWPELARNKFFPRWTAFSTTNGEYRLHHRTRITFENQLKTG